jgi:quinol monooxygenase YgiN
MSKVFLFVEVNVKPGKMDEFVNKIKAHAAVIRTEAGCEFLDIYRNTQKSDVLNVWEIWSDRPAWDAHMVNENSKAWQKVAQDYVFGESITVMKNLDE